MHNFLLIDMGEHNVINANRSSLDLKSIPGKAAFSRYHDYDTPGIVFNIYYSGPISYAYVHHALEGTLSAVSRMEIQHPATPRVLH